MPDPRNDAPAIIGQAITVLQDGTLVIPATVSTHYQSVLRELSLNKSQIISIVQNHINSNAFVFASLVGDLVSIGLHEGGNVKQALDDGISDLSKMSNEPARIAVLRGLSLPILDNAIGFLNSLATYSGTPASLQSAASGSAVDLATVYTTIMNDDLSSHDAAWTAATASLKATTSNLQSNLKKIAADIAIIGKISDALSILASIAVFL